MQLTRTRNPPLPTGKNTYRCLYVIIRIHECTNACICANIYTLTHIHTQSHRHTNSQTYIAHIRGGTEKFLALSVS